MGCRAAVPTGDYQALRIRILRPLRVRFIVEMRSYSKTDLQQTLFYASFMCVIKKSLHRKIAYDCVLRWICLLDSDNSEDDCALMVSIILSRKPVTVNVLTEIVERLYFLGFHENNPWWCHNKMSMHSGREARAHRLYVGGYVFHEIVLMASLQYHRSINAASRYSIKQTAISLFMVKALQGRYKTVKSRSFVKLIDHPHRFPTP